MADNRLNLYQDPDTFRMQADGVWYITQMPQGWQQVEFVLERDPKYHGFNFEYNNGSIELGFDRAAGGDILREQYETYGHDAIVRFQFGTDTADGFRPDVDGYVDFTTYKRDRDKVTASVKRKTFNDDLETKNEVVVTVTDGYITLPLHSKIIRQVSAVSMSVKTGALTPMPADRRPDLAISNEVPVAIYGFLDWSNAKPSDLTTNAPQFGVQSSSPLDNKNYIFKSEGDGAFTFSLDFSLHLYTKVVQPFIASSAPETGYWVYRWYLVIVRQRAVIPTLIGSQLTGNQDSRFNDIDATFTINTTLNLLQDDELYIYGEYIMEAKGSVQSLEAQMDLRYANLQISGLSAAKPSTAKALMVHELAQSIFSQLTGGVATLRSNLLGRTDLGYPADGCASLTAYSSGYLIRGFDLTERPLQITYKDWIAGLNSLYGIGMAYEPTGDDSYVVRIEDLAYFYRDVKIMTFYGVTDYSEAIDTSRLYNQVEFGYQKYPTDDEGTLDEFNTKHSYLAPTASYKTTFSQICPQIGSGDAIELTRRKQVDKTKKDTFKYDEDNFVIASVRNGSGFRPEKAENYTATGIVGAETAYNLRFTITRMIERWGLWLNSAWAYKPTSDVLKNTYVAKNGDLTSQYTGTSPCESKEQFTESADIYISQIAGGNKLMYPETISFTAGVNWQQLSDLKRCYTGADTGGRNYGYMEVIDGNGEIRQGYLKSMTYNPATEATNFVLYRKYVPLIEPENCPVYSNYNYSMFEQQNVPFSEIANCRYDNFN